MKNFDDFSPREQAEALERARIWFNLHTMHVHELIKHAKYPYSPSGSDALHPELWKGEHWRWWAETIKVIE